MQISAKQRLHRLAVGSIFAAGMVLIPGAVASADGEDGDAGIKAPRLPDEVPTDPIEDPIPDNGEG